MPCHIQTGEYLLRIVLLVAHSPNGESQHRYVAKKLADEFPDELAAIIVATGVDRSPMERAKRWWRRYTVRQLASRVLARAYRKFTNADFHRQYTYREVLFPEGDNGEMPRSDLVQRVPSHNGSECLEIIGDLDPDVVAVYGTLIIGKKVIAASKRMINIHTGLSPEYRGSDTIFWSLHNSEPHYVGVTVHRVDAGVDSGPILARGRPEIRSTDGENRLFAKAVRLGAELMCRAIRREMDASSRPMPQDLRRGREYRAVDRTLAAELRVRKLLNNGLLLEECDEWSEEF